MSRYSLRTVRSFFLCAAVLLPALLSVSCGGNSTIRPASSEPLSYAPWNTVLEKYVDTAGYVDYEAAKEDKEFWRFIGMLNGASPSTMSKEEELAFWINAYNALTWQLLFDNMPLESITDIAGGLAGVISPLTSPWELKVARIEGKEWTLQEIEDNKVLALGDDGVHFAINCASFSCPKLLRTAYTAENIAELTAQNRRAYLANRNENYLREGKIYLSKIFDWYKSDFVQEKELVTTYAAKYWPNPAEAKTIAAMAEKQIEFADYNWTLNSQQNKKTPR